MNNGENKAKNYETAMSSTSKNNEGKYSDSSSSKSRDRSRSTRSKHYFKLPLL